MRRVARRPQIGRRDDVLSRDDLKSIRQSLSRLSLPGVRDYYRRAYEACRLTDRDFPSARVMQQVGQAWKQLRQWGNR